MDEIKILEGKKVLVVDDEEDILETLRELLDVCSVNTARDFISAEKLLRKNKYDFAVFDIMGVNGYSLLNIAQEKNIPAIMLTAHALSPESIIKAIKEGAHAYLPKHAIADIASYIADILTNLQMGRKKSAAWFVRLKPTFDEHFGEGWEKKDKQFWRDFAEQYVVSKEELRRVL
ncbi:MAG: response regulator [Deltaproteobacteria bacterium]|nr:response regulator [Deltaproteobacteria bacterium]